MTKPNSPSNKKDENTARFRAILSAGGEAAPAPPPVKQSLMDRLPRAGKRPATPKVTAPAPKQTAAPVSYSAPEATGSRSGPRRFGPAFWTATGILSLVVNSVLIALVIILLGQVSTMRSALSAANDLKSLPLDTISGLYRNFEAMEAAHIRTVIPLETMVPVTLTVCIKTGTSVVINQDVTIPNARVTVQTGGLNISNALTTIVLPGNTALPVNLDLCVPLETTILVKLNVDVDIPLAKTDLNAPFTGLQDVIAPLYCLLDKQALTSQGTLVCDEVPAPSQ